MRNCGAAPLSGTGKRRYEIERDIDDDWHLRSLLYNIQRDTSLSPV